MEGCSRNATGYVASMQLGEGGATSAQRLTDRGASAKVVNLGILYIQIYIQICSILYMRAHEARPPQAGSDRWLSKRSCSAIHRCALSPGGARRACAVRVLLEGLHVQHRAEHL